MEINTTTTILSLFALFPSEITEVLRFILEKVVAGFIRSFGRRASSSEYTPTKVIANLYPPSPTASASTTTESSLSKASLSTINKLGHSYSERRIPQIFYDSRTGSDDALSLVSPDIVIDQDNPFSDRSKASGLAVPFEISVRKQQPSSEILQTFRKSQRLSFVKVNGQRWSRRSSSSLLPLSPSSNKSLTDSSGITNPTLSKLSIPSSRWQQSLLKSQPNMNASGGGFELARRRSKSFTTQPIPESSSTTMTRATFRRSSNLVLSPAMRKRLSVHDKMILDRLQCMGENS